MNLHLTLASRYLREHKLRTTLTTLAIILGVMLIFGLNGLVPPVREAFRQDLMLAANQVDMTLTQEGRRAFASHLIDQVRQTPGVAYATPSLVRPMILPATQALTTLDGEAVTALTLYGLEADSVADVLPLTLTNGRFLQPQDEHALLLSHGLAQRLGAQPGHTLRLPAAAGFIELEIVGLLTSPPLEMQNVVYVPLATAQTIFNVPGQINTIDVLFAAGSEAEAVRHTLLTNLGGRYQAVSSIDTDLLAAIETFEFAYTLFGLMTLVMGGFIIFNTFRTIVAERRQDIGLLRTIGASRRTILGIILTESVLQGVMGTAIGIGLGYLMAAGLITGLTPLWQSFMYSSLGPASFAPAAYLQAIGAGIGITLLAGFFPALAASRVSPIEALRPFVEEPSPPPPISKQTIMGIALVVAALLCLVAGHLGLAVLGILLFMSGLTLIGPQLVQPIARIFGHLIILAFAREGHIAQGNLSRQPGRAAITASTITIGLAILVALTGVITSITTSFAYWTNKSLGADYLFMPPSLVLSGGNIGAGPQLGQQLSTIPGVSTVSTLRLTTTQTEDYGGLQLVGIDPTTYPQVSGLTFTEGTASEAYAALAAERAIIINGIFAAQNRVQVGHALTLLTPDGAQTYRVAAVGSDFLNVKLATGYISQANLEKDFQETADLLIMVNQAETADADQVHATLQEIAAAYPTFSLYTSQAWRDEFSVTTLSKLNLLYLLIITLAVPALIALINTLVINVLERTREIGMMRAVGATRRQIGRLILAESLLLAAAGTSFGLISGVWLGYILLKALQTGGVDVPYTLPYLGLLLTTAVGLLFGVLGALIPARRAAQTDIILALAYE